MSNLYTFYRIFDAKTKPLMLFLLQKAKLSYAHFRAESGEISSDTQIE